MQLYDSRESREARTEIVKKRTANGRRTEEKWRGKKKNGRVGEGRANRGGNECIKGLSIWSG